MPYVAEDLLRQVDRMRFGEQSKALISDFERQQEEAAKAQREAAKAAEAERATMPTVATEPVAGPAQTEEPVDPASWLPTFASLAAPFTSRISQQQPAPSATATTQPAAMPSAPAEPSERRLVQRGPTRPTDDASANPLSWLPSLDSLTEPFRARMAPAQPEQPPATPSGAPAAMPSSTRRLSTGEEVNPIIVDGRQERPADVLPEIDSSSPEAFFNSARPYAEQVERESGGRISAEAILAIAANETGYGQARYMAGEHNYFGIQAPSDDPNGVPYRDWRPGPNGEKVYYEARQRSFADPLDAFRGFARVLETTPGRNGEPRYGLAMDRYQQTGDSAQFARDLHAAGYAEDPDWSNKLTSIMRGIPVKTGVGEVEAPAGLKPGAVTMSQRPKPAPLPTSFAPEGDWRRTWGANLTPDQIEETKALGLDYESQLATCGIAGAVAFDRANGGEVMTFGQALQLAEEMGEWNKQVGMTGGTQGQIRLLKRLGVDAYSGAVNEQEMVRTIQSGQPVQVNAHGSGGHFYVAMDVRQGPNGVEFDFGNSAAILRRAKGRRWFRLDELADLGVGTPAEAIYLRGKN